MKTNNNFKAGVILSCISLSMTIFIVLGFINNSIGFMNFMGFNECALKIPLAWLSSIILTIGYIAYTAHMMPLVRNNLFNFKGVLKWIGIYAALTGGIMEELVFRKILMDWLNVNDIVVVLQIFISGVVFGLVHLTWSFLGGNLRIGIGSTLSTFILGLLLAVTYIISERNVLPVIFAHVTINLFIEPWLMVSVINESKSK